MCPLESTPGIESNGSSTFTDDKEDGVDDFEYGTAVVLNRASIFAGPAIRDVVSAVDFSAIKPRMERSVMRCLGVEIDVALRLGGSQRLGSRPVRHGDGRETDVVVSFNNGEDVRLGSTSQSPKPVVDIRSPGMDCIIYLLRSDLVPGVSSRSTGIPSGENNNRC